MDKNSAIEISKQYLQKVKHHNIDFTEAWLFGSFATGNNHVNSDIDIAIVLTSPSKTFETEVRLMTIRKGEETLIEPHAFTKEEFDINSPIVFQIINNGLKIEA